MPLVYLQEISTYETDKAKSKLVMLTHLRPIVTLTANAICQYSKLKTITNTHKKEITAFNKFIAPFLLDFCNSLFYTPQEVVNVGSRPFCFLAKLHNKIGI